MSSLADNRMLVCKKDAHVGLSYPCSIFLKCCNSWVRRPVVRVLKIMFMALKLLLILLVDDEFLTDLYHIAFQMVPPLDIRNADMVFLGNLA